MSPALRMLVSIGGGALIGFLWFRMFGCSKGTCGLTNQWYLTTGYGAFIGFLVGLGP